MEPPAAQATSQSSSANVVTHPAAQGASASQVQPQSTGPSSRPDPKTKPLTTDQQGVRNIVAGVLESQGVGREDWQQSLRTDYRVEPLPPPTWVVHPPAGKQLASTEGGPVDESSPGAQCHIGKVD